MNKPRAPRPVRRMATEIHEDSRTHRQRARGDEERAILLFESMDWDDDASDKIYAEMYERQQP